ncbi:unnamed protein product [Somion occarium]|uniref:Protein kinase domain-containing protein n=1 Tax=Somion occarium TaxID=3059160 RepID=A0ABP1CPC1_9APHY
MSSQHTIVKLSSHRIARIPEYKALKAWLDICTSGSGGILLRIPFTTADLEMSAAQSDYGNHDSLVSSSNPLHLDVTNNSHVSSPEDRSGSQTPLHGQSASWWGSRLHRTRPWPWNDNPSTSMYVIHQSLAGSRVTTSTFTNDDAKDSSQLGEYPTASLSPDKANLREIQVEGWIRTKNKVIMAICRTCDIAMDGTHVLLEVSSELLGLAPITGLEVAAKTLLNIWDAVEKFETNRLACLRLTERCADILISVRDEITDTGEHSVSRELEGPVEKLEKAFSGVYVLLSQQHARPFLQRYLKRDEIQREIAECDAALLLALHSFSVKIQMRTYRQVMQSETSRKADAAVVMDKLTKIGSRLITSSQIDIPARTRNATFTDPPSILSDLQSRQNRRDNLCDIVDLRELMRHAVEAKDDMEMIRVLQVGRDEMPEAMKTLQRALEVDSEKLEKSSTPWNDSSHFESPEDSLDLLFMKSSIESLRRLSASRGAEVQLPSWTITRYEVDREEKIGIGFFSDVYRGRWRNHVVAIKVLAETTPRQLFVREVEIWKTLKHPNVLKLYGASSTTAEPPWFLVSPYCRYGSLVGYLRGLPGTRVDPPGVDLLKIIHEITKGMVYLHTNDVLHGDLRAANILVDDSHSCVISDFGHSEMKSEAYRISGTPMPRGTLRWQAPEILLGQHKLTQRIDVYAFAICCVEIVSKGSLPWPLADDDAVRRYILDLNLRPEIPAGQSWRVPLRAMLNDCWHRIPESRPLFSDIENRVIQLRQYWTVTSRDRHLEDEPDTLDDHDSTSGSSTVGSYHSAQSSYTDSDDEVPWAQLDVSLAQLQSDSEMPVGGEDLSSDNEGGTTSYAPSSLYYGQTTTSQTSFWSENASAGPRSTIPNGAWPPDTFDTLSSDDISDALSEELYRTLLRHEFHPSLSLPLWSPTPVKLGAVGYLCEPQGYFVTLF